MSRLSKAVRTLIEAHRAKSAARWAARSPILAAPKRRVEDLFGRLSDEDWSKILIRSVTERTIDGLVFPDFPPIEVQARFVGSSNAAALREAASFYSLLKNRSAELGKPVTCESSLLDFGCGWGRFLRLFWRDIDKSRLAGVDVDPTMIELCKSSGIEAQLHHIENIGRLPFPDESFSHIMAYSVFTHLPEQVHMHWIRELHRVAKSDCIFICTTEPRRFLEFVDSIQDPSNTWHAGLKKSAGDIAPLLKQFDDGQFTYIPTGGGQYRDSSVYGDAAIPLEWMSRNWHPRFKITDYIDDKSLFWQSVVIAQRL